MKSHLEESRECLRPTEEWNEILDNPPGDLLPCTPHDMILSWMISSHHCC